MNACKRGCVLVSIMLAALAVSRSATAQVTTTTVQDTIYRADGTPAAGTVVISWSAFTTAAARALPAGNTSVTIGTAGLLTVALAPNAGATPMGSYYTAVYHLNDGTTSREYWVVPVVVSGTVNLAAIRNQVLPFTVAMQTVSKQYVDAAIAAAVGSPTGAASGDLAGSYPGPTVSQAQGGAVTFTATTGVIKGGTNRTTYANQLDLSGLSGFPTVDIQFPGGNCPTSTGPCYRMASVAVYGTADTFNQLLTTSGSNGVLEVYSASGNPSLYLGPYTAGGTGTGNINFTLNRTTKMRLYNSGGLYLGSTPSDPGANNLAVQAGITAAGYAETLTTPSSSTATCTAGQFTDDASYHYVCVSANTWKRAALSSF